MPFSVPARLQQVATTFRRSDKGCLCRRLPPLHRLVHLQPNCHVESLAGIRALEARERQHRKAATQRPNFMCCCPQAAGHIWRAHPIWHCQHCSSTALLAVIGSPQTAHTRPECSQHLRNAPHILCHGFDRYTSRHNRTSSWPKLEAYTGASGSRSSSPTGCVRNIFDGSLGSTSLHRKISNLLDSQSGGRNDAFKHGDLKPFARLIVRRHFVHGGRRRGRRLPQNQFRSTNPQQTAAV